ncbi:sodium-dependent dicarboxylate transporter SdcS [Halarchaeum grantii]|uniref:Sodium-dependent dicarboxylate transporter SdcS n=1 Tax=Halarchaeum grantii TaxID=1193105 RepID=A0A830F3V5_9EURY|nr:DASS family sodium-coupled anion symporter [Halarchaeum grantii]GGL37944.1 sodium-dependent dicarboxylate transporter SdcS [Halarchaeum grantii]
MRTTLRDSVARLPPYRTLGLFAGPLCFALLYATNPVEVSADASAVLAVTGWIVVWWVTEAIPIPATSLLPLALFPVVGAAPIGTVSTSYADPVVFLLLGGFCIALAVERWDLHRRVSLAVVTAVGVGSARLLLGFMLAAAVLSMWISNTAAAMLMVPIAASVISQLQSPSPEASVEGGIVPGIEADPDSLPQTAFGRALMLGIAYACAIGGIATVIGSPPNAVLVGVAESALGVEIGFLDWMLAGVPLAAVMLVATWLLLLRLERPELDLGPADVAAVEGQLGELGAMSRGERRVLGVFCLVAAGWLLRPFVLADAAPLLTDAGIAVVGGVLTFVVPVDLSKRQFLLAWEDTTRVPWGVLLLLGAGFAIASAFQRSGLDHVVAGALAGLGGLDLLALVFLVGIVVLALTNVTSNTATATLFMPVMLSLGPSLGVSPVTLMTTAAFAASFAFVLPVGTPPNAVVFASGYLTIPQMARTGVWVSLVGAIALALTVAFWLPVVWGF